MLVESLRAKKPDASFFEMDGDNFSVNGLEELIVSMGLFEQKYIIALDNIFQNKEAKEFILKRIKEIGLSENIFIFLEGELDKKTVTKIEKHSEKVQEFIKSIQNKKQKDFNIFSLTDAICRRDRKKAWVLFQQAVAEGVSPENIHGTIFWGIKSILLATSAKRAKEAGLSPFVFSKSILFSKNFKEGELENISSRLVSVYHESRRGGMELSAALEIFILSI
jgi:DNA polymerase III delta subunit